MRHWKEAWLILYQLDCAVFGRFVNQNNSPEGKLFQAVGHPICRKVNCVNITLWVVLLRYLIKTNVVSFY